MTKKPKRRETITVGRAEDYSDNNSYSGENYETCLTAYEQEKEIGCCQRKRWTVVIGILILVTLGALIFLILCILTMSMPPDFSRLSTRRSSAALNVLVPNDNKHAGSLIEPLPPVTHKTLFIQDEPQDTSIWNSTKVNLKPNSIPSTYPSARPTFFATHKPSTSPTDKPSKISTLSQTSTPSVTPSRLPSFIPSHLPSFIPSHLPSFIPSRFPSLSPSDTPTQAPTPPKAPTSNPTVDVMKNTKSTFHSIDLFDRLNVDVSFCALGDIPYSQPQEGKLLQQLAEIPLTCDFVVHVGDIMKTGGSECKRAAYQRVDEILQTSPIPLFLLPGDNEMMQCSNQKDAWENWKDFFYGYDKYFDMRRLKVNRQYERPENFSLFHKGVLFIGLNHVAGDNIVDVQEWIQQDMDNLQWLKQNMHVYGDFARSMVLFVHALKVHRHYDFFIPFFDRALKFGKPILMLHGDGHVWEYEPNFNGVEGSYQNLKVNNILRVQVARGGLEAPVKVTVGIDKINPFEFERQS